MLNHLPQTSGTLTSLLPLYLSLQKFKKRVRSKRKSKKCVKTNCRSNFFPLFHPKRLDWLGIGRQRAEQCSAVQLRLHGGAVNLADLIRRAALEARRRWCRAPNKGGGGSPAPWRTPRLAHPPTPPRAPSAVYDATAPSAHAACSRGISVRHGRWSPPAVGLERNRDQKQKKRMESIRIPAIYSRIISAFSLCTNSKH